MSGAMKPKTIPPMWIRIDHSFSSAGLIGSGTEDE